MNHKDFDILVILGPTAGSKTLLASNLAFHLNGEIISADSRQVYKRMNLGTGKDYDDYMVQGIKIPCHLIDIKEPGYKYNLFEYQQDFYKAFEDIKNRGKLPVLCGGSGLYIEAVIKGYSMLQVPVNEPLRRSLENKSLDELAKILSSYKKLHNKTDIDTKKRAIRAIEIAEYQQTNADALMQLPALKSLNIGVVFNREIQRRRIADRLLKRLKEGMVDEVRLLLEEGLKPDDLIYYGLEYKYITLFLTGKLSYDEMIEKLTIAIQQFAKRQMTWFRRMERGGVKIFWIDGSLPFEDKIKKVMEIITAQSETNRITSP